MRLRFVSVSLMVLGALFLMTGFGFLMPGAAYAQEPLPQPSPRPAVQFVDQDADNSSSRAASAGHITGTVIDSASGAPVAGMPVLVGELQLVTDANGNYDTWLAQGTYLVNVAPAAGQGAVVDQPMLVTILPDTVTIQHLRVALVAPAVPEAVAVEAVAVEAVAVEVAQAPIAPARLPRTNDAANSAWLWVVLGVILMAFGFGLGAWPAGRRMLFAGTRLNDHALLAALLHERPASRKLRDDELLKKLLE